MQTETRFILLARPASIFTPWEELSAREQAMCYYSDTHKEAYGYRPYINPEATAGQIARATRDCVRVIHREAQWEREENTRRVKEANARALAKRRAARAHAETFTLGARWP